MSLLEKNIRGGNDFRGRKGKSDQVGDDSSQWERQDVYSRVFGSAIRNGAGQECISSRDLVGEKGQTRIDRNL